MVETHCSDEVGIVWTREAAAQIEVKVEVKVGVEVKVEVKAEVVVR